MGKGNRQGDSSFQDSPAETLAWVNDAPDSPLGARRVVSMWGGRVSLGISSHKITYRGKALERRFLGSGHKWTFYPSGIAYESSARGGNHEGNTDGGKRGVINGWSTRSRQRMREFLVSHVAPRGWSSWGVTFEVPGDVRGCTVKHYAELWRVMGQWVQRQGWGMVWRLELQKRNAPHWHCLLIAPAEFCEVTKGCLWEKWALYLDHYLPVPPHKADTSFRNKEGVTVYRWAVWGRSCYTTEPYFRRSLWAGAEEHCIDVKGDGSSGSWLRYLQDHATKYKQAQVADGAGWGRHWGVVGRKYFREAEGVEIRASRRAVWFAVRRWLRRLRSPSVPAPSAPFGRRIRRVPAGFVTGRRVVFGKPETHKRMIEYAEKLYGSGKKTGDD